jgi:hypothetical protein
VASAWPSLRLTRSDYKPSQLSSLQSLLNQEILMSDSAMPHDPHQLRALHALMPPGTDDLGGQNADDTGPHDRTLARRAVP